LGEEEKSARQLANEMKVSIEKLSPLLYALVSGGLLQLSGEGFVNTIEAQEFLVKGAPRYFGGSHSTYHDLWSSTLHTATSILTGIPQAKHEFSSMSSEELESFIIGLDAGAAASARRLHKAYDFSRFRQILDAGGGSGGLALELAKLCPKSSTTVAELPSVAAIARRQILENDVSGRVDVVESDLTGQEGLGMTYDAIVIRSVIQVLGVTEVLALVNNVSEALNQYGEIFVVGRVLENDRLNPPEAVAANVMFLNVYVNGQAYTLHEYEDWFAQRGLRLEDKQALTGGYTMLQFVKRLKR